jgi:gamma-glutamyl-gamma-aminobutyraldehyde dehydrogenase
MTLELKQEEIARLADLPPPTVKAIIGGGLCDAASGRTRPSVSPIDGATIAEIPECGADDVDRAVAAARKSFADRRWRLMSPKQRKRLLLRWVELIEAEALRLAVLETRDMGMPVQMAAELDIGFAIDTLRWYAEACDKLYDEVATLEDNVTAMIMREPLGVVGAILPWNAPAMVGSWKIGPALITGNSVIVKPAEDASLVLMRIGELALEAGIPEGVLQIVPGDGVAGAALAAHRDVDCIAFTGSGEVGRSIMTASAASNLKRVSLELGGKSANIVMADAPDLSAAAEISVRFMFGNQGQVCEAPTRLFVERKIRDRFVEEVTAKAKALRIGNPLELSSDLGPVVSATQFATINERIARAEREGARFVLDGRRTTVPSKGFYMGPTIADNVGPMSSLAQEEVFGPVLSVFTFDTLDEAIDAANDTRYGLGASIWSRDIEAVMYAAKRLVAGNINVNGGAGPVVELPYGGFKESGFGRDRSFHAIEKYAETKNVIVRTTR